MNDVMVHAGVSDFVVVFRAHHAVIKFPNEQLSNR